MYLFTLLEIPFASFKHKGEAIGFGWNEAH